MRLLIIRAARRCLVNVASTAASCRVMTTSAAQYQPQPVQVPPVHGHCGREAVTFSCHVRVHLSDCPCPRTHTLPMQERSSTGCLRHFCTNLSPCCRQSPVDSICWWRHVDPISQTYLLRRVSSRPIVTWKPSATVICLHICSFQKLVCLFAIIAKTTQKTTRKVAVQLAKTTTAR